MRNVFKCEEMCLNVMGLGKETGFTGEDETRIITVPEGLIAQGHNGDYAAKIIKIFYMC